jgi:hypothetical protein
MALVLPEEPREIPPASTAIILIEEKDSLNRRFMSVRPAVAVCRSRAIQPSAQVMIVVNTDRSNHLQKSDCDRMRAMRAVF